MRTAFARALEKLAERDPRVWLLTGDLGYSVLEPFMTRFPERSLNVGVAEQNMAGIAAGLAADGNVVFVYSIANFPTFRCLEQIRNDICYPGLSVRIVSVGGGLSYGTAGYTHHGIEDLAVMRALPGMAVIAPGDPFEAELATHALVGRPGPAYLRLGKAGEPLVHSEPPAFELGRAITLRTGTDLTLIATGGMLKAAVTAADELRASNGLSVRVLSMHTVKPLDVAAVLTAAHETGLVVSVEEHSEVGGLGSAVAEVMAGISGARARLSTYALPDRVTAGVVGSQRYLLDRLGSVADHVRRALAREPARIAS